MSKWNKVSDMKRLSRMVMPLDAIEGLPDNHIISVTERTIEIDESELVQNNVSTDTYTLELDAEWDDITPVVIFSNSQGDYQVAYENGPTKIPAAVMAVVGSVDVSVFGLDSTGAVRVVTKAAPNTMTVVESGKFVGEVSEDDISLLGQLLAAAEAANEAAANANATIIKSAVATTLEPGEPATANIADNVLTIGVPKGEKGDKGDQGDPGQDGTNGIDGVTPFTQATVTTLEPDSPATVAIEEDTLKLGIPKGEKGDKGDTGDKGPQGEPGQDATLPEGMVTADDIGVLSRLGSGGEPSIMTDVIVGNTANSTSATMSTWGNSPNVSILNAQTKAEVGFGLVDGEPVLIAGKSQSDQKVYGFSPTIPEDDTLTVVTSDAYKADTDPLKQRIAELENQAANVVTGISTDLVSHGEDAFPQKPREVRIKGKTWVNRWPEFDETTTDNGVTLTCDETGLFTLSGTATSLTIFSKPVNGFAAGKQVALSKSGGTGFSAIFTVGSSTQNIAVSVSTSNTATGTIASDATVFNANIRVDSGTTVNASFRIMLVDGTEAPDCFTPPASIASVETGNLVTSGKNLFPTGNNEGWYKGGYSSSRAFILRNTSVTLPFTSFAESTGVGNAFRVVAGQTYTLTVTGYPSDFSTGICWALYEILEDTSDPRKAVAYTIGGGKAKSLTTGALPISGYLVVTIAGQWTDGTTNAGEYPAGIRIQCELGSTATAYEPPSITQTPLPEVELRSLPNGTCDELVIRADGSCEVERVLKRFDSDSSGWNNYGTSGELAYISIGTDLGFPTSIWNDVISELPVVKSVAANDTLIAPHWAYNGRIVFFRFPTTEASNLSSAIEYMESIGAYCYAQVPMTTEPQTPVTLPALPAPTFNQYHDSPVPSDTSTQYVRDINLVLANLESVQAALLGGE